LLCPWAIPRVGKRNRSKIYPHPRALLEMVLLAGCGEIKAPSSTMAPKPYNTSKGKTHSFVRNRP